MTMTKLSKKNPEKKTRVRVYECAHYEYDCDDLGKYCWCHNRDIPDRECNVGRGYYCQQFCPGYKKGELKGSWVISDWEKADAEEFKKSLDAELRPVELNKRVIEEYIKEKLKQ